MNDETVTVAPKVGDVAWRVLDIPDEAHLLSRGWSG